MRTPADGPAHARLTPYELAFGRGGYETDSFPAILEEAGAGGGSATFDRFLVLRTVGRLLAQLEAGASPADDATESPLPDAGAVRRYGPLVFQAYRFWEAGRKLLIAGESTARSLLEETSPVGDWGFAAPYPAGYVQLPRHLIWSRTGDDAPWEAVDGWFWSVASDASAAETVGRLDVLLVMGMHPGRSGFGIVDVMAALPAPAPGHWADAQARESGPDFGNVLPGGELRGLYSLVSVAEVLKLVSRLFHVIATRPASLRDAPASGAGPGSVHELPPSEIAASIVVIEA